MINDRNSDNSSPFVDHAAQAADDAIQSTQRLANDTLDRLSDSVQNARREATSRLDRAADRTTALAQRGLDVVRDTSQSLRDTAARASDSTILYIRDQPLKSMLIAAATGAALMALIGLLGRSSRRG